MQASGITVSRKGGRGMETGDRRQKAGNKIHSQSNKSSQINSNREQCLIQAQGIRLDQDGRQNRQETVKNLKPEREEENGEFGFDWERRKFGEAGLYPVLCAMQI